jgi:hypothetical protein
MSPEDVVALFEALGLAVARPDLTPGEAIHPPRDFPSVEDLAVFADGFNNPGHQRALIVSYFGPNGDPAELIAGGMMPQVAVGAMVTITYFDEVTVWDYADETRTVSAPALGRMTLRAGGEWTEDGTFEAPAVGPLLEQFDVQSLAAQALGQDVEVFGYERLVGVDTIKVSYRIQGEGVDVWVTGGGLVMRLIYDLGDPNAPETLSYIWNVETLDAELSGPLPPGI